MLKKSLVSPAQPLRIFRPPALSLPRRHLRPRTRLFPCCVLASLRGSTYRTGLLGCRNSWRGFSVRQDSFDRRTAHMKCGTHLLASLLAAAFPAERRVSARRGWAGEDSGLFEHPPDYSGTITLRSLVQHAAQKTEFSCRLLEGRVLQHRLLPRAFCHFPF